MTELDEIRQSKLEELAKRQEQQRAEAEAERKITEILRHALTEEARARLANVKLVNAELYLRAVQAIVYLFNSKQVKGKVDEEQVKLLLKRLCERKEIKIRRK